MNDNWYGTTLEYTSYFVVHDDFCSAKNTLGEGGKKGVYWGGTRIPEDQGPKAGHTHDGVQ
eukprot:NODE_2219_length_496_cov_109.742729_g1813_i0.p1 GENE.NODE_2219_length_496_cov_109.742729_g1813_i0~~NODE_2219_length_496_cov_109.742729_g1813_i0.p1  ORF type:complete len:61 (-),score=2.25 NODE_2219_length_496_cov_109.742729_g1813_i0:224-406(-)